MRWTGQRAEDTGARLDSGVRAVLEATLDVDLSGVRLHSGPRTDAFLEARGLHAAAAGHRVYLPTRDRLRGRGERLGTAPNALRVLAHEVAHTVQQASGLGWATAACEVGAELAAAAAVEGVPAPDGWLPGGVPPQAPRAGHGVAVVAGFGSWEHQLLGDLTAAQLATVASKASGWQDVLNSIVGMLAQWIPGKAVPLGALPTLPGVRYVLLPQGGLATYGELCALADFIANPNSYTLPEAVLFGFLQQIRQETYNQLLVLLGKTPNVSFGGSIFPFVERGTWTTSLDLGREVTAIDRYSQLLGVYGNDHYKGLLARNACHFAPFAWYRWAQARTNAIAVAEMAQWIPPMARKPAEDAAWARLAYAEHFLQDSFSAGHLTNKTLVMQYFIDWSIANDHALWSDDWESIREVTLAQQPNLWGPALYSDPSLLRSSNDPQTAEEQASRIARMDRTGVVAYGAATQPEAYLQYLAFLRNPVMELSSNQVHNYYNDNGLTVANAASGTPYLIYGDDNLFKTAGQVQVMGPVLADFRQAVPNGILGEPVESSADVLARLPQYVKEGNGALSPLASWNRGTLSQQVRTIFSNADSHFSRDGLSLLGGSMGIVSVDEVVVGMQRDWMAPLAGSGITNVYWDGQRLFAATDSVLYQLNPSDGTILASNPLATVTGYGTMSLTASEDTLYVGKNGHLFALPVNNIGQAQPTSTQLTPQNAFVELLLTDDGHLYAAVPGTVSELDPKTLAFRKSYSNELLETSTPRLAASDTVLAVGALGRVICLQRSDITTMIGQPAPMETMMPEVAVTSIDGSIWAACGLTRGLVNQQAGGFSILLTVDGVPEGEARLGAFGGYLLHTINAYLVVADATTGVGIGSAKLTPGVWPTSVTNPLSLDDAVFAAANGMVYEFDVDEHGPSPINTTQVGLPQTEVRLASDGVRIFCGALTGLSCGVWSLLLDQAIN